MVSYEKDKKMQLHLLIGGAFKLNAMFTPFCSVYKCWEFNNGVVEYREYYIFGIRIARLVV